MNPEFSINCKSLEELDNAAKQILEHAGSEKIFAIEGEMGAGKTTLIKAICKILGVNETVTSPTFALVNEYSTTSGETIFHFDLYRIKNINEALDIGIEEYFSSGHRCFLEWPNKISELLPKNHSVIHISEDDSIRMIKLIKLGI